MVELQITLACRAHAELRRFKATIALPTAAPISGTHGQTPKNGRAQPWSSLTEEKFTSAVIRAALTAVTGIMAEADKQSTSAGQLSIDARASVARPSSRALVLADFCDTLQIINTGQATRQIMAHNKQLVYDVGMHQGEDTEFYLKKGFQVVAFEAHPGHVKFCRDRFARELECGQLHIVEGAIAPPLSSGKIKFYINKTVSVWGTIDQGWVARNAAAGTNSVEIEVEVVNIVDILDKFGIPFYLKIDIEGADSLVLDALKPYDIRPDFISCEINAVDPSALMHDIETLSALGYKQFQLVPQEVIGGSFVDTKTVHGEDLVHMFGEGASGVFGVELPGAWIDRDALIGSLRHPFNGWQDIHASLSESNTPNVALNRLATQSSTSAWSSDSNPEVDARIANNGDAVSQKHFHTSLEVGPWWQVDLGELHFIDKIVIFNRIDCSDRLRRLSVLGSENGRNWFPLFRKMDDSHFYVFAANVIGLSPARFVRVRLDGHSYLHFRECQIFGRPAKLDP